VVIGVSSAEAGDVHGQQVSAEANGDPRRPPDLGVAFRGRR
jgi:hypothetical protein